ncbi:hypothetical protein [Pectinatus haikarae]|uniref:Uncharacterized protein n=1 Tax=Pectinatus haikarae TaxID=349096 RepID=A0ABT9Y8V5_9FIRM|nr:hypothetical protein [Pectinatus haikarae]MDQ0204161.1 hypothetical protein [Pectinatus haikarae]
MRRSENTSAVFLLSFKMQKALPHDKWKCFLHRPTGKIIIVGTALLFKFSPVLVKEKGIPQLSNLKNRHSLHSPLIAAETIRAA